MVPVSNDGIVSRECDTRTAADINLLLARCILDFNEIAGAAASAVVTAMATNAWSDVRTKFARILGRGESSDEEEALTELDGMHSTYAAARPELKPEVARDLTAELRGQLRSRLRGDASFAAEFEALAEEISNHLGKSGGGLTVNQYGQSEGKSTFIQVGHDYRDERQR
ncbi:hypothetical protein [Actinoplanes aureus]|uniref:Uncharacterized protein n=1 Tax=Actinoplanes aureus TaxID=2792083 RepID=A0A931G4Z4_9ACTN|nr:hypothetical protein [Actinoplanes aureus]MBG0568411.1 hypothetical protein [Actinoplanes aureus]